MQDCIDGINPLCFSEINENTITINEKPLFFEFGEPYNQVISKLSDIKIEPYEINKINRGDYSAIDNLLDDFSFDDNNDNSNLT